MAIDLLNLTPHKVSRDLSGYITYVYGRPKTGKTTLATQMPNSLLLAFERGYNALPGVIAQDITSWAEMKQVYRELKKPEVQKTFKALVVDTVDIASDMCQKYICSQLGIENIGDGGWTTNGWSKYKKEFEEMFRSLTQMGYAVFFISHAKEKTVKRPDNTEYTQVVPALQSSALSIIENMADIYGYAHQVRAENGSKVILTLRHPDDSIACGGRFKYIAPEIDFNYESLVKALTDAIDKEANATNNQFVTEERENISTLVDYNYDALMEEFQSIAGNLMQKNAANYGPRITQVIEKYLGKGKKIADTTRDQAEFVYLILTEIKEDILPLE